MYCTINNAINTELLFISTPHHQKYKKVIEFQSVDSFTHRLEYPITDQITLE